MNEEEDIILPEGFDENTPVDIDEQQETDELEGLDTNETESKPDGEVKVDEKNDSDDSDKKLLEALKGKVKYNHEEVEINSLDDIVEKYQKGLNYDKLNDKLENDSGLKYLDEKAKELGFKDRDQYLESLRKYEEEQKKAQQEQKVQEMISSGVDEATAKRVAGVEAYMEDLKRKEQELTEKENSIKAKESKEQEQIEFLKAYPDVKVEEIPAEVFEQTKNGKSLLNAYVEFENKKLKEEIGQLKKNNENKDTSVVKGVSETGATEQTDSDMFLQGFNEE